MSSEAASRHIAATSRWADLGVPVHYVDHGGPAGGPVLVMVHGLGGSLVNWAALAPLLTDTCRVLALDLIGFGLTKAGTQSTSVASNQQMLQRFLTEVVSGPVILVGNSMGAMIAILQAVRHSETVTAVVLVDPPLPGLWDARPDALVAAGFGLYAVPPLGLPLLNARPRARAPDPLPMALLRLCLVAPSRVAPAAPLTFASIPRSSQLFVRLPNERPLPLTSLTSPSQRKRSRKSASHAAPRAPARTVAS